MFKASVRKGVSLTVVAVILLSGALLAGCSPDPYPGINIAWDFSYLFSKCDFSESEIPIEETFLVYFEPGEFETFSGTVGEFIDELLAILPEAELPCSGFPTNIALYMRDSNGTRVIPDDSSLVFLADATEDTFLYFGPASKHGEAVRLTLFGYVMDGNNSCVLWSLDGTPNAHADEKCGGEAKLVCTVKLVDKNLKYSCKDGYDWLGNQIVTDPDWKSWAEQFASKNGRP